jgi:hypothetical protein
MPCDAGHVTKSPGLGPGKNVNMAKKLFACLSPLMIALTVRVSIVRGHHIINLNLDSTCIWTELFDRFGCDVRNATSVTNTSYHELFENDDILKKIVSSLTPSKLALLSQVSKRLFCVARADAVWIPWLFKLWTCNVVDQAGSHKCAFDEYLSRMARLRRSVFSLFAQRATCRRKVRRGWAELSRFAGTRSRLRAGLSEPEISALEAAFSCHLPMQLRELYRICDGEHAEWGSAHEGIMNGYRFLPLREALALLAEARACGGDASVLPLTQLAGFGSAGDGYEAALGSGDVLKVS